MSITALLLIYYGLNIFFYSFFRAMAEKTPKTDSNEKSKYLLHSLKMNSNMKLNMKIQSTVEHEGLCTS